MNGNVCTTKIESIGDIYMAETILVVDDEKEIVDLLAVYLENENFKVFKCYTAKEALNYVEMEAEKLDLAILDVMLPDISGYEICKKIRENYQYPIIMLTAKGEEIDKIKGLTLGADDYVTKPFLPLELVARVKAQLRRYKRYNTVTEFEQHTFTYAGLVVNAKSRTCTLNEKTLQLTPIEFAILQKLCEQQGTVVSSEELFHSVWADEYYQKNNNTITVHIRHLREKMGDSFEHPKYIKTVWGVGYQLGT